MNQIEYAKGKLKSAGIKYEEIEEVTIKGGINSKIYVVTQGGEAKYAFKFYKKKTEEDCRNRAMRESRYLEYLEKAGIEERPIKILIDEKDQWGIITWIEGTKKEKIFEEDITQIAKFIERTNKEELFCKEAEKKLPNASEAWLCKENVISTIRMKADKVFKELKTKNSYIRSNEDARKLIKKIEDGFKKEIEKLENKRNQGYWESAKVGKYASPSDVGIHNTISSMGKIYIIDFEYAGIDDISKLVADWVMQPKYEFNKAEEELLIRKICEIDNIRRYDSEWVERYKSIKCINAYKWTILMLKACGETEATARRKLIQAEGYLRRQLDR